MMGERENKEPNHLIKEKSPYLLQHAYNPVDWYPWNEEAFRKAKEEDKPVFLSIGYSTCHWCHVMAHESFEDEKVARLLNRVFVPIKVDREERPDIDKTYMAFCQMMTGSGGWPLNVVMTPEKIPFFVTTYLPRKGRRGRKGMLELIPQIEDIWENHREKVYDTADEIMTNFDKINQNNKDQINEDIMDRTYKHLDSLYDEKYGGFGSAPKFPMPHQLVFLLRYGKRKGNFSALEMVRHTLKALRAGGIFDQLGYGFHRYSTDEKWLLPHFEKMLYDQALLMYAYTEAYQVTGYKLFAETVDEIYRYVKRKLQGVEKGFYAAEDADSEGEEGKFYLWETEEIDKILSQQEVEKFKEYYHVEDKGNFPEEGSGKFTGKNILYVTPGELNGLNKYKDSRQKLFEYREKRTHPHLDDKILTDWNGLMIAALARASFVFNNNAYLKSAEMAADFILSEMFYENTLYHRYRLGDRDITGNLDDYSFFIWGLMELYQTTQKPIYLRKALKLQEIQDKLFWDPVEGGYYFTDKESKELPVNKKETYDGALPAGNSVALLNLIRLSEITAKEEYRVKAEEVIQVIGGDIKQSPTGHTFSLLGFDYLTAPSRQLIITEGKKEEALSLIKKIRKLHLPFLTIIYKNKENKKILEEILPYLQEYPLEDETKYYLCQNFNCHLPTTKPEDIINNLKDENKEKPTV